MEESNTVEFPNEHKVGRLSRLEDLSSGEQKMVLERTISKVDEIELKSIESTRRGSNSGSSKKEREGQIQRVQNMD